MRHLACVLLMLLSMNAFAAGQDDELQRIYSALNMLNQEQLSIYQQFQMVQAMRREDFPSSHGPILPVPSGETVNYDDVIAEQNRAIRRSEALAQEARRLFTRYGEVEEAKKPLQQQILRLMNGNN